MKDKITKNSRQGISWLINQPTDVKMSLLTQHLELCKMIINEMIEDNVVGYAGERYSHEKPKDSRYSRWGSNPGGVRIGDEKVHIEVPRLIDNNNGETFSPGIYEKIKKNRAGEERIMAGMLHGLSTRNYKDVIDISGEAFGMSRSAISQRFIEHTTQALERFRSRQFEAHNFMGLLIDGINIGGEMMLIAMGITDKGQKIVLDFVQSATEHHGPIKTMLRQLIERGFKVEDGLICVIDGSKGIRKAIKDVFGEKAFIQRCTWHKRENVLNYLSEKHQEWFKTRYHEALSSTSYETALSALKKLIKELTPINVQAATSLAEGLEELLTLHRLAYLTKDPSLVKYLSKSLSTTNCIENLNSNLRRTFGRVSHWTNSDQRQRWMAAALLEIEPRLNKIKHAKKINKLKEAFYLSLHPKSKKRSLNFN
jgi:putative transposase